MVTFRNNNNRRPSFRNNNNRRSTFRRNDEGSKFSNNDNFQRKVPGRNNHNASKLIEKYNNLAREALSVGDKIMSENYFQHADHFTRILNEKESFKKLKNNDTSSLTNNIEVKDEKKVEDNSEKKNETEEKVQSEAV